MTDETYSVSRLRSYADCPRKYWWQYRQDAKKVSPSYKQSAADIGSLFHATIETVLRVWHKTGDTDAALQLSEVMPTLWYTDTDGNEIDDLADVGEGVLVTPDDVRHERAWARVKQFSRYYATEILTNRGLKRVASLPDGDAAVEVELQLDVGGHKMKGFVDAVFVNERDELIAVDWKCRATNYPQESILLDSQLYFYMYALRQQFNINVAYALQVELGTKALTIVPHRLDAAHADRMTAELLTVADRLAADSTFAGRNDAYHCKSCDYLRECTSLLTG